MLKQAMQHHQAGQFREAEAKYRQILAADPNNVDANHFLGLIAFQFGHDEIAVQLIGKAVALAPDYAEAHSNLGNVLSKQKKIEEAIKCYRKALAIRPKFAEALHNLGNALAVQEKLEEAIALFRKALSINPKFAEAHYNLGRVLDGMGDSDKALACFKKTLSLAPRHPAAQTFLAIYSWINKEWQPLAKSLDQLAPIQINDNFVKPYRLLLSTLLKYRGSHQGEYDVDPALPALYALGDSNCLSPAHVAVTFEESKYRVEPKIIIGCKAWHLANDQDNRYKHKFEKIASTLPSQAVVVVMFGDIDCRLDEGIIRNFKKTGCDLDESIRSLVQNYTAYVSGVFSQKDLYPIFQGVPAPMLETGVLPPEDEKLLTEVVFKFNRYLAEETAAAEQVLLDVYGLTNDQAGISSGSYFIERKHLLPPVLGDMLSKAKKNG